MTYSTVVLADSPRGYWRLGEAAGTNADNAEGTAGRDGTYTAGYTLNQTGALTGDSDPAVLLATTGYVNCGTDFSFGPGACSFECWFKTTNTGYNTLIGKGDGSVWLLVDGGDHTIHWGQSGLGDGCHSSVTVNDGNWHHVVGTKTAAQAYLVYVDGSDVTVYDGTAEPWNTAGYPLDIGVDYQTGTRRWFFNGTIDEVAVYDAVLTSTQVATHYAAGMGTLGPVWTTPADTVSMSTTPELKFNSPTSAVKQHFYLQLDTANTFDTGNLRTYDSSTDQTNWDYWDGAAWTAMPSDGLPIAKSGNEIRYTVTSALSSATWYRRVRAGTLV